MIIQIFTFFWFSIFCFGLTMLVADAHVFGCNIYDYETGEESPFKIGIIPLRPYLFHFRFFRELFRCYFCTGMWCGAFAHLLFRDFYQENYWLWHEPTTLKWSEGILIAAIMGAFVSYFLDQFFKCLEYYSSGNWEG